MFHSFTKDIRILTLDSGINIGLPLLVFGFLVKNHLFLVLTNAETFQDMYYFVIRT